MLMSAVFGHADNVLLMGGRTRLSLVNVIASLSTSVVLYLALVPAHGLTGGAVAWAAGIAIYRGLAFAEGWYLFGTHPFGPEVGMVAAISALLFVVAAIGRRVLGDGPLGVVVTLILASAVFAVAAWHGRDRLGLDDLAAILRPGAPPPTP